MPGQKQPHKSTRRPRRRPRHPEWGVPRQLDASACPGSSRAGTHNPPFASPAQYYRATRHLPRRRRGRRQRRGAHNQLQDYPQSGADTRTHCQSRPSRGMKRRPPALGTWPILAQPPAWDKFFKTAIETDTVYETSTVHRTCLLTCRPRTLHRHTSHPCLCRPPFHQNPR